MRDDPVCSFSQQELDALIACRKTIVDPPKKTMPSLHGSLRNNMVVHSEKGDHFHAFMRQSEKFNEDFSIGLSYQKPDGGSIILLRCNGPHGDVRDHYSGIPHFGYHVHRAMVSNLQQGLRAEAGAEITEGFASFQQALKFFLREANIEWTDEHFPTLRQQMFLDDD